LLTSLFVLAPLTVKAQDYQFNKKENTTSKGVVQYIQDKDTLINKQFDKKFNVNSFYIDFVPDALRDYVGYDEEKGLYLGHKGRGEAIIDTVESFDNYSLKDLSEKKKDSIIWSYGSVRGTMIHEKAHGFFQQVKSRLEKQGIRHYYHDYDQFYFSQSFIEEGVAQYCAYNMGEIVIPEKYRPSDSLENLIKKKSSELRYDYSLYYLKYFLDFFGLKHGTEILLTNPPPRKHELIRPLEYYKRLEDYQGLDLGFFPRFFKPQDFKTEQPSIIRK